MVKAMYGPLLLFGLSVPVTADVIAGPVIAIYIGIRLLLPLLLVALVILVTVFLIKKLKKRNLKDTNERNEVSQ